MIYTIRFIICSTILTDFNLNEANRAWQSPFKWLYIGTERGNVHLVNYENFLLNDYVINWNKGLYIRF